MGVKNLAVLSGLPLMVAGILGSAVAANAATVVGTLEISTSNLQAIATGQQDPLGNFTAALDFGFIGDRTPGQPDRVPGVGEFVINSADGVLDNFNPPPFLAGRIKDLPVNGVFSPVDDFLSFASGIDNTPPVTNPAEFDTTFDLLELERVTYTQTANGINANFDVNGIFTLADGTQYEGEGLIGGEILFTAQPGRPFDDLASFLDYLETPGNLINVDSVSANFDLFQPPAPVPEPASVLGLLAVGALGATRLSKRKQS
jgi:PEP-CTERM motif